MNTSVIVKESNTEDDELRRMMSVCNACRYCEGFARYSPP